MRTGLSGLRVVTVTLAFLWAGVSATYAGTAPDIPLPKDAQLSIVGDALWVNGFPMQIYELQSSSPLQEIIDFYLERWAGAVKESKPPGWHLVSHPEGEYLFTVQLRVTEGHGSFGYIALSPAFRSNVETRRQRVELPPGSQVLSDLESVDRGRQSRTVVFRNQMSVDQNISWIGGHYRRKGWRVASSESARRPLGDSQALLLSKAGGEVNLAVGRNAGASYGTLVLVEP